ncbi:MAG: hypothetical protein U9N34_06745 [Candidatus Cloacimonadota bacterium]|nr:hypothetical protein [Candidatus Cloacimonadota bacterium]
MKFIKSLLRIAFYALLVYFGKKIHDIVMNIIRNGGKTIIFNGIDKKVEAKEDFTSNLNVIFGGAQLDIRNCEMFHKTDSLKFNLYFSGLKLDFTNCETKEKEIEINLSGMYSGFKINVPKNWNVVFEGDEFKSGIKSDVEEIEDPKTTLFINYNLKYSGISIK